MQNTVISVTPVIPQHKQPVARDGLRPDTVITGANLVTCDGDDDSDDDVRSDAVTRKPLELLDNDSNDGDDGDLRLNAARQGG